MGQFFSIGWRILVNLAITAVILAVFYIADSMFQTVIISILVFVYVSLIGSFSVLWRALFKKWDQDLARFIVRANLFQRSNTEIYEEMQKEYRRDLERMRIGYWIEAGFNTLFTLIAIGNLAYAVVS